ncbi:MAG: ABC transporter ATP-binding protein, partial [Acidimicrobiia bacterium]|nr:ABC transporter ATP-binding protein [Acidimicrobiia bacterium]
RERLVRSLDDLGRDAGIPMVLVTHHVDDIPGSFTHIIMLNNGEVIASGEIKQTLTSQAVSDTFDMPLEVSFEAGRFRATAPRG